jgi:hypothetical protein
MSEQAQGADNVELAHSDGDSPPAISRRQRRMVPRPPAEDAGPVVSRDYLHASRSSVKPQTRRDRRLVGTLPDWEPLPPGEVLIDKPRSSP